MATDAVRRLRALLTITTPDKMAMASPYAASGYCDAIVRAAAEVCRQEEAALKRNGLIRAAYVAGAIADDILSALDPKGGDDA